MVRAIFVASVAALTTFSSPTYARDGARDAKKIYQEATVAFSLGRYDIAAAKYEEAFALHPDPAVLYNAAQAYRLAGNKRRALELYKNCVRVFPDSPSAADARTHIASLKTELDNEAPPVAPPPAAAATSPETPLAPAPAAGAEATSPPPAALGAPQPPAPAAPAPTATASSLANPATVSNVPAPAERDTGRSLFRRWWFWGVVGAAVVGAATAIALSTRGTTYPEATYGTAKGN